MEARTLRLLDFPRLLEHLGECALSEAGKRACLRIEPLQAPDQLRELTRFLDEALRYRREVEQGLSGFPDLEGVFGYLAGEKIVDEDGLWAVGEAVRSADAAREMLSGVDSLDAPLLAGFADSLRLPAKTRQGIARCLDSSGELADSSSPELYSVRQEMRRIQSQCTRKINDHLQDKGLGSYLQDDYLTISADRYVLALKTNFKGRIDGVVHDYSQTGETCYFEPMFLVELNNRLQELKHEEREAKRKVLAYLTSLMGQEIEELRGTFDWLLELDLLRAKTILAGKMEATTLDIGEEEQLGLYQARHPLLLLGREEVQPVDLVLKSHQRGLVISGGNSGGKTVCLKALGLISAMAMSGLPVPVREGSTLPLWSDILVFLGDEQSLEEHLSTFTAQIEHFRQAWGKIGPGALVLLDEFGSGTDPSQGAALAQAVVDAVLERNGWVVAATHFPALKAYALSKPEVRSASVLFDPETKLPLYRLAFDQVGASQALNVARDHGMPREILQRAEEYMLLDGEDTSQLIDRLNTLAVQRENELEGLEREKKELQAERKRMREKYARESERLAGEIRSYAREILQRWKAGKIGRKQALRELGKQREELAGHSDTEERGTAPGLSWQGLQTGQKVYYRPWGRSGKVLDKDEKKGKVKLDLGGVSVWVEPGEMAPASGGEPEREGQVVDTSRSPLQGVHLDLRGQRSEEAEIMLQRFVDQALLQGREELEVIHGRGTGALRSTVHEFLRNAPHIRSYRLAPEDRGGDGVTLVELE
jgi:DNA mismatch repair protein MutS2